MSVYLTTVIHFMPEAQGDHGPMVINVYPHLVQGKHPFRYLICGVKLQVSDQSLILPGVLLYKDIICIRCFADSS